MTQGEVQGCKGVLHDLDAVIREKHYCLTGSMQMLVMRTNQLFQLID